MEKFAGKKSARCVLHEEVINSVAAAHPADGLTAHYLGSDGVNAVWLDVLDVRKMNAVFVAERQIRQQIS